MKQILFVDDERHVLNGVRRQFSRQRAEWDMAFLDRADDVLARLQGGQPVDLVVTDLRMPGRDGNRLIAWLARHHPNVGRISLSGNASAAYTPLSRHCAHVELRKPCPADELESGIRRLLEVRDVIAAPAWAPLARVFTTAPCASVACSAFDAAVAAGDFGCTPCPLAPAHGELFEQVDALHARAESAPRAVLGRATPRPATLSGTLHAARFAQAFLADWQGSARLALAAQLVALIEERPEPVQQLALQAGLVLPVLDQVPDDVPASVQRRTLAFLLESWSLEPEAAQAIAALRAPDPADDTVLALLAPLAGAALVVDAHEGPWLAAGQRAVLRQLAEVSSWEDRLARWGEAWRVVRAGVVV